MLKKITKLIVISFVVSLLVQTLAILFASKHMSGTGSHEMSNLAAGFELLKVYLSDPGFAVAALAPLFLPVFISSFLSAFIATRILQKK